MLSPLIISDIDFGFLRAAFSASVNIRLALGFGPDFGGLGFLRPIRFAIPDTAHLDFAPMIVAI